ncbi:MAG: alpha/beta hydrolase [Pseudomonadota bacterium]
MTACTELVLDTASGQSLHALRSGSGPKVLALHGWLDNAMSFAPMRPFLDQLDLVCLDFPGHGQSPPRPATARYHFDDYVFDALATADALGWSTFHLLGHSLGGGVASVTSAACPQRILSLSLIEGLGPLTASSDQTASGWQRAIQVSRERPRRLHADLDQALAARTRHSDLPIQAAQLLAERGLERADQGWHWRHDLRLTWPSTQRYTEAQVLDVLGAITAPTLCIMADPPSPFVSDAQFERRVAAVRQLNWMRMPGGHHLHMESPAALATPIQQHILESHHGPT